MDGAAVAGGIMLKEPESMFFERSSIKRPMVFELVLNSYNEGG